MNQIHKWNTTSYTILTKVMAPCKRRKGWSINSGSFTWASLLEDLAHTVPRSFFVIR